MPATFTRVNAVIVDESFSQTWDAFLDPGFVAGTYNANLAIDLNPLASTGALYRGMPISLASSSGGIIPYASTAQFGGVLVQDITPWQVARNGKISLVRKGRIRSYAGGALTFGQEVKPDPAGNGFVAWVAGTDAVDLRAGRAYPTQDGSTGTPGTTMAQGDTIFVDLQLV